MNKMFSREKPNNLRRRLRYLAKVKYLNQNSGSYQIDNYDSEWLYVVGNSTIHNSHIRHFIKEDFTEKKNLWFGYEITDILVYKTYDYVYCVGGDISTSDDKEYSLFDNKINCHYCGEEIYCSDENKKLTRSVGFWYTYPDGNRVNFCCDKHRENWKNDC